MQQEQQQLMILLKTSSSSILSLDTAEAGCLDLHASEVDSGFWTILDLLKEEMRREKPWPRASSKGQSDAIIITLQSCASCGIGMRRRVRIGRSEEEEALSCVGHAWYSWAGRTIVRHSLDLQRATKNLRKCDA